MDSGLAARLFALNASQRRIPRYVVDSAYDRTYGGRVTPEPITATAARTVSAVAAAPTSRASSDRAPAVVDVAADDNAGTGVANTADGTETDPAAGSVDAERPATRMSGGNKFEPNRTGSTGATSVGGQKHSGSTPIGSTLGKIVKSVKKALTPE